MKAPLADYIAHHAAQLSRKPNPGHPPVSDTECRPRREFLLKPKTPLGDFDESDPLADGAHPGNASLFQASIAEADQVVVIAVVVSGEPRNSELSDSHSAADVSGESHRGVQEPGESGEARERAPAPEHGLCPRCSHVRLLKSERGSTFLLCTLAKVDRRFTKYPPQPVLACSGFSE